MTLSSVTFFGLIFRRGYPLRNAYKEALNLHGLPFFQITV
ncbi:hypothetical protein H4S14_001498 [Agrobacterium vitis]|nr:hypothetical protein [Agrobacterium vitis]MBE1437760.1 hypothetical protein [Agrobacterium vitis]